jgi:hypothetical protein
MKQLLALVAVAVIGLLAWFLRGGSDATVIDAKNAQIAALNDAGRCKDQLLAQTSSQVNDRNETITALQGKIKSDEDLLIKNQAQIDADKVAYQKLQNGDQTLINSLKSDNDADIQALKGQIRDKENEISQLNEKLVQIIADYETKLNALRNQLASSGPEDAKKIYPKDDGFEMQDNLGPDNFNYFAEVHPDQIHFSPPAPVPNQSGWQFGGNAGIAARGSTFISYATNGNHNGKMSSSGQAAFLQTKGSWISQMVKLPAGTYSVSFDFEGRINYEPANGIAVSLNGTDLYVGAPSDANSFTHITTNTITLTVAKEYELKFRGLGALSDPDGDHSTLIDNVCINIVGSHKHSGKTLADGINPAK